MRNLINGSESFHLSQMLWTVDCVLFVVDRDVFVNENSGNFRNSMRLFLERFVGKSEWPDLIQVDNHRHHADFFEPVHFRQVYDFSIFRYHVSTVKILSLWKTFCVHINVGSSVSFSQFRNHLNFPFQFSPCDLRGWAIYENLSSIQSCIDHGIVRNPGLLTNFISQSCVLKIDDKDTNGNSDLSSEFLNHLWQLELSNLSFVLPCWKTSSLIVHVPIRSDCFDSDGHNLALVENDSSIVKSCLMEHWSTKFANYLLCDSRF